MPADQSNRYAFYIPGPTGILEVIVESPEKPKTKGDWWVAGDAMFLATKVIAIVPESQRKATHSWGNPT